jgi:hypothetical protein
METKIYEVDDCEDFSEALHRIEIQNEIIVKSAKRYNITGKDETTRTEVDKVVEALDCLKEMEPETEITMETPEGCLSLMIKDALVYETMGGGITIDSE